MRMGHFFPPCLGIRSISPNKYMIFFFFYLKLFFPKKMMKALWVWRRKTLKCATAKTVLLSSFNLLLFTYKGS